MRTFLNDVGYAVRSLRRSPGVTLLTIVTLALGIGANTAVFTVIRGVLLKPLPYQDAERLVVIQQSRARGGPGGTGVSIKEYFGYRELPAFASLVEYHQMSFDLLKRGEPDRVSTGVVSHDFFETLGIRPLLGRTFRAADDQPGAEAVLILSHPYWRDRFGADPGIVGQRFEMNGRPHTVVGVLPDVPMYPQANDVYMPVRVCPFRAAAEKNIAQNARVFGILNVFGRLRPGTTRAAAAAEVGALCERFGHDDPRAYPPENRIQATAADVGEALTTNARPMLLVLLGTTALVLLLACANVSNLTLARVMRRERELAIRAALGAGRARLVRLLVTESLVLSLLGGGLGLLCAAGTLDLLTAFTARFTGRIQQIGFDPWILAFAVALSVAAGVLFGVAPALMARIDLGQALNEGARGTTSAPRRRLQGGLVVAQVAVSVVLLSGAGLLLASFVKLQQVDPGYRADSVLSAEAFGNFVRYPDTQPLLAFYARVLDRLRAQPGVTSAAVTNAVPLSTIQPFAVPLTIQGDDADARTAPTTDVRVVSEGYFETLGVPLLAGRLVQESDGPDAPAVALVNRSLTGRWGGREVIGSRLSLDGGQNWLTVVGVVGDMRMFSLAADSGAQVYVPLRQAGPFGLAGRVLVRSALPASATAALVRDAIRAEDPEMPIENVQTVDALRAASLATPRLTATLLALFAGVALVIALVGVTGVVAASVSQRTQEFGVRMALGAQRPQVLRMVLRQGLGLVAAGVAIGIAGALALDRVLASFLYETAPGDPVTLLAAAALFTVAGLAACLGPAVRATSVDPLVALRR